MRKLKLFTTLALAFLLLASCQDSSPADHPDPGQPAPPQVQVQFNKIDLPTELPLRKIQFASSQIGYIVTGTSYPSNKGSILKTTNGGKTWNTVFESDSFYFNDVSCKNTTTVVAVTNNGTILNSKDGGQQWSKLETFTDKGYYMSSVSHTKNDELYIVGQKGALSKGFILHSTDSGSSWNDLEKNNTNPALDYATLLHNNIPTCIAYHAPSDALIFSGGIWSEGKVAIQQNNFWDVYNPKQPVRFTDLAMKEGFVITVGNNGQTGSGGERGAMHTYDSQTKLWTTIDYGFQNKLTAVALHNQQIIAVGANNSNNLIDGEFIIHSADQGKTWQRLKHSFVTAGWEDVYAYDHRTFYALGYKGLLVKLTVN